MCLNTGILQNIEINIDQSNFSLDGMVSPSFQNEGNCDILLDGRLLKVGESYSVNVPTIVLSNEIAIQFLTTNPADKKLMVGCVRPI